MQKHVVSLLVFVAVLSVGMVLTSVDGTPHQVFAEDPPNTNSDSDSAPVDDMHHFMEYINEPLF